MPMDAAQLTLAKLNSFLGGKGGEWGSETAPTGAALPAEVRSRARELGNQGHTAAAGDLLLQGAIRVKANLPAALLDEFEQTVLPQAESQNLRASIGGNLALLRHTAATAPANTGPAGLNQPTSAAKPGLLGKLFKRG